MKLDMDCMRDVMLKIELMQDISVDEESNVSFEPLWIDALYEVLSQYAKKDIFYALHNLDQAGYVSTNIVSGDDSAMGYAINYITYEGHNFLDKIRDPKAWKYIKTAGSAIGNFSLSVINQIANGVTTAVIDSYLSKNPFKS